MKRALGSCSMRKPVWMIVLILFAGTAPFVVQAEDGRDFAGFYESRDALEVGDEVVLTFALLLFNCTDATVEDATVALRDSIALDLTYGTAVIALLEPRGSVRLDIEATVRRAEYEAWQAGATPSLSIEYAGPGNGMIRRPVELALLVGEE